MSRRSRRDDDDLTAPRPRTGDAGVQEFEDRGKMSYGAPPEEPAPTGVERLGEAGFDAPIRGTLLGSIDTGPAADAPDGPDPIRPGGARPGAELLQGVDEHEVEYDLARIDPLVAADEHEVEYDLVRLDPRTGADEHEVEYDLARDVDDLDLS